jgi:hypothetical protein
VPEFDQYNFYYDQEELQRLADPSMTDGDFISNIQSPTSQRWSCYFLCSPPALRDDEMSITYPDLIAYATNLEAELNCTIHTI